MTIEHDGRYIQIVNIGMSPSGKTQRFVVRAKDPIGTNLGSVSWFGRWGKYAFKPTTGTVFECVCLEEIAIVVRRLTLERQERRTPKAPEQVSIPTSSK